MGKINSNGVTRPTIRKERVEKELFGEQRFVLATSIWGYCTGRYDPWRKVSHGWQRF